MVNFVSIQSEENKIRLKNMYLVWIFIWFSWILFHFTIVFFFWFALESVFLVWLFLWIWNFVAMLFDIPVWVLQKYIKPKTFLLIATGMMILACIIFIKFTFFEWISDLFLPKWWEDLIDKSITFVWEFLSSWLNIVLIAICACLYWLIKESFDVTTLSYIFNNASPSEYASIISKYNINFWIWSMIWLIFSWILLSLNIKIAIFVFLIIIICFFLFILTFFDNNDRTVNVSDVKNIKLDVIKSNITQKSNDIIQNISTKNFITLAKTTKVVLLKPVEIKKSINFWEVYNTSVEEFKRFLKVILWIPINKIIIWLLLVMSLYGFWDTFVSTFQVDFLKKIIEINKDTFLITQTKWLITAYVLLWLLVIPAFVFQDMFIKLSKKLWVFKIIMFWTFISSISLFFFWVFDELTFVLLFWFINSIWYAAAMPIAQSSFSQRYNQDYAKKYDLKEIDSSVSAAPLKIILNFANVIWVLFWWLLVWILWFNWFFMFFWWVLFIFFIFSLFSIKTINTKDLDIKDDLENELEIVNEELEKEKETNFKTKKDEDFE